MNLLKEIQEKINSLPQEMIGELSDGYHTFNELYEFRKMYNAALFNAWAIKDEVIRTYAINTKTEIDKNSQVYKNVHKSWKHNDGELCFGGGWFIVSAMLPTGQISNHYPASDWDLFRVPICEKALFEYDNHTPQDVISRLKSLINE